MVYRCRTETPFACNSVPRQAQLIEYQRQQNNVFKFRDRSIIYDYLDRWAKKASIEKHVTFHMSRHTCATLLLYYGADLYTVSKILGHTSIKTTQIYAKVADEMKRKAVSNIPEIK